MVMVFIYRIFYMYIFKRGLHQSHVQGWDRTSAYIGAAGSHNQSIGDLTQPMSQNTKTRPAHRELHALLFAISVWVL